MEIIIIGGFLGGGKTTLLNHLVSEAMTQGLQPAVIMNEFGKQSVDGQLIDQEIPLNELTEGCICCAMKADVSDQLHQLYLDYQPDIVFIECSGIAEPLAVVDACLTPILAPFTRIKYMVGIVDVHMYQSLKSYPKDIQGLFYEQLSHCSHLFVNKIDLTHVDVTSQLLKELEIINPEADIQVGMYGRITLPKYTKTTDNNLQMTKTKIDHQSLHQGIHHQYIETPVKCNQLQFIDYLDALPSNIYRMKGFIQFIDEPHTYLVQYMQDQFELTPIAFEKEVPNYLVLIGKNIQYDDYRQLCNSNNVEVSY